MRFFLDENFPVPLIKPLRELGHDAVRVTLKSPDPEIAERAKNEGRVILIRIHPPDKDVVFNTMEGLIHHFKFFMSGFDVPEGEAYTPFEAGNGELGFYIVSKGAPKAHRMRIRGPSFWHYQALSPMCEGKLIGDLVAALGSINIIAGEIDR